MKSIKFSLLFLGVVIVFSACTIGQFNHKTLPSTSFTPHHVKLNLSMNDFEYLGETEISVSKRTYLGMFTCLDSINGVYKDIHHKTFTTLYGNHNIQINKNLNQAVYKVIEQYPTADYFVSVSHTKEETRLFGGSRITYKAVIKAYKLKIHN